MIATYPVEYATIHTNRSKQTSYYLHICNDRELYPDTLSDLDYYLGCYYMHGILTDHVTYILLYRGRR
jgi:hypothetical protein